MLQISTKSKTKKNSGSRKKKSRNGGRYPSGGRDFIKTGSGISSTVLPHPAVQAADPLAVGIAAQLSPFNVPKGTAKKLVDSLQSQAITARGTSTVSVPPNNTLLMFVENCVANDTINSSVFLVVCPNINLVDATSTITSSTAANFPANCTGYTIPTNTPYTAATLAGGDYNWRLVGAGVRVRNVSEQLYRGGIFRYVLDTQGTINGQVAVNSTKFSEIITILNGCQHSVRKHFSDDSLIEILVPAGSLNEWSGMSGNYDASFVGTTQAMTGGTAYGNYTGTGAGRVFGTTSGVVCGYQPMVWGYFVNSGTGTQTLDFEVIEHWEVHGSTISTLHTPSANHVQSQALVTSIMEHVATNHSNNPHLHFKDVVKEAVKLSHNKQACKDASIAASIALAM